MQLHQNLKTPLPSLTGEHKSNINIAIITILSNLHPKQTLNRTINTLKTLAKI